LVALRPVSGRSRRQAQLPVMRYSLVPVSFLLLTAAAEVPFEPDPMPFADAAACTRHLETLTQQAAAAGYDAVEGPYRIAEGDVRIHMVRAEGAGHRITEHRCLGPTLSARSWSHSMEQDEPEFTVESVARTAPWLKQRRPEQ
jgi:hypothetical protein